MLTPMDVQKGKLGYEVPQVVVDRINALVQQHQQRHWQIVSAAMLMFCEASEDDRNAAIDRILSGRRPGRPSFEDMFSVPRLPEPDAGEEEKNVMRQGSAAAILPTATDDGAKGNSPKSKRRGR